MELLIPALAVMLGSIGLFAVGAGFAWLAWYVDRAWRRPGLATLWIGGAALGASLLAAWVYSRPESPRSVAGAAPFAVGFPLLLTAFGAASASVARHRRDGVRPPRTLVLTAAAAHFWAAWGFTVVLAIADTAFARFWR